ncbi:Uncharacterized protein dnm_084110 [Desulfonema magnum]|uniref:Uncharacterized protein n=1 Tax=Desulfonema magnum TaxID=45655 RepID=A0A975BVE3_9BACT|nr:Uncharacterized protein dnm_084110 [Desulfonema magnum]
MKTLCSLLKHLVWIDKPETVRFFNSESRVCKSYLIRDSA